MIFLKSFSEVTKLMQGHEANINLVLPVLNFLLKKFENEAISSGSESFMALAVGTGFLKLQKY